MIFTISAFVVVCSIIVAVFIVIVNNIPPNQHEVDTVGYFNLTKKYLPANMDVMTVKPTNLESGRVYTINEYYERRANE